MILLIDNYDSFVYNLYQLLGNFSNEIEVRRNEITVEQVKQLDPQAIIISPGPGKPSEAGNIEAIIKYFYDKKPILRVCLGHQAICEAFGATISYAKELMHGKSSIIDVNDDLLFKGLNAKVKVGRYHSLTAIKDSLSDELQVIATSEDNEVMAIKHRKYPVYGMQFHPESILTIDGKMMIKNFLEVCNHD